MLSDTPESSSGSHAECGRLQGITGVILAGGENRRFPEPKALIRVDGQTIIEHHVRILRSLFDEVLISTNTPDVFFPFGVPLIGDILPSLGPISGIHAALRNTSAEAVFIVACDMPFICGDVIRCICRRYHAAAMGGIVTAVIPSCAGQPQPLMGVYHRSLLPGLETAIATGKTALKRFLREAGALVVDEHCLNAAGIEDRVFVNINTLEDYKRVFGAPHESQALRSAG